MHINDHHSHLDEEQMELSIDNDQGQSTAYTVSRGGFARVAALIKQLETKTEPQLKLHAGDATTGDLYYTLSKGQADADLMNTVCFDAFTIGNHEFDGKDEGLKTFIDALDRGQCAKPTAVLSANVQFGPSSVLYQSSRVQKSTVIETQG
ncbi:metallophosphoesterase [Acinetobacter soli]|uniref:metallophosphoesterase n=1 Tax=Acinetobacter soli TaxID=487316 RepID=UPI001D18DB10|nr:metallophosphoesterase [Acinetobacter soli]WEH91673.1 metallophosphoesterase [Acinetobacter soli]WEH96868.1 metallophosphoesterase [Acinetobacter soli]WEI00206.1 metallophosphoesterase [Acinetobacter soli]